MNIYQEERPWGNFRKFTDNSVSTVKIITVLPNKKLSLQSHKKRSEFWRVIKGNGVFIVGNNTKKIKTGDEQYIPIGSKHRIISGGEGIVVLEISKGEFDENDIIRFEDDYGRS